MVRVWGLMFTPNLKSDLDGQESVLWVAEVDTEIQGPDEKNHRSSTGKGSSLAQVITMNDDLRADFKICIKVFI